MCPGLLVAGSSQVQAQWGLLLAPALSLNLPLYWDSFLPFPTMCPVRSWHMVMCVLQGTLPLSLLVPRGSFVLPTYPFSLREHPRDRGSILWLRVLPWNIQLVVGQTEEVRPTALCVISTSCFSTGYQHQSGWRLLMDTIHVIFITNKILYVAGQRTASSLTHWSSQQADQ